jgi:hypothetical protein
LRPSLGFQPCKSRTLTFSYIALSQIPNTSWHMVDIQQVWVRCINWAVHSYGKLKLLECCSLERPCNATPSIYRTVLNICFRATSGAQEWTHGPWH